MSEIPMLREFPRPYDGHRCTKRDHVVRGDALAPADTRLHSCDCGCALIGNGRVEIRFGLIDYRFPTGEASA